LSKAEKKFPLYFKEYLKFFALFQSCYSLIGLFLAEPLTIFCGTLYGQSCSVVQVSGPSLLRHNIPWILFRPVYSALTSPGVHMILPDAKYLSFIPWWVMAAI